MKSVSHKTDRHPPVTRTDESITVMGQLRVEKPPTQTITGWLWVGQKPDPPDPWTALGTSFHRYILLQCQSEYILEHLRHTN